METKLFPCTALAEEIQNKVKKSAEEFKAQFGRSPCLAVVLCGNDPASEVYVRKKGETCVAYGIDHRDYRLSPADGFEKLVSLIRDLNADDGVDGILVQSPLPKGWDEAAIQAMIDPAKDADGFHPINAGRLAIDAKKELAEGLVPCTPAGVIEVLVSQGIPMAGKHAVVVGRSNIVGKPMALMLLAHDATVTICHSRTPDLVAVTSTADILVSAVGKPQFIGRRHVKAGATVIDVGINRNDKKLVGDVDAAALMGHAGFVTPVPRGIGPMTIALLLRNTVRAAWGRKAT